jgi:hypothetical protein
MQRGKVVVALAALVASALVSAAATQLGGLGSSSLGSEAVTVSPCTSGGAQADFVTEGLLVTAVEVTGLPAGCTGKSLYVSVSTAAGLGGESSGPVQAAATTLTLGTTVPARSVESVSVVVTG